MRSPRRRWFSPAVAIPWIAVLLMTGCGDAGHEDPGELRDADRIEAAPMCPWRNPASDVTAWFPGATRVDTEVRILSGMRPELAQRLGRQPSAAENALYVHQIRRGTELVGEIATCRVKGESGAVELVVAFLPNGRIHGVRMQRSREPEPVAAALQGDWLTAFRGTSAADLTPRGAALPPVPEAAQPTANAILEGIRSLCILREIADKPGTLRRPAPEAAAHLH